MRRRSVAIHEQQPEAILLHAGLIAGGRRPVLKLAVHHAGVGMRGGRGGRAGRAVGRPGEEARVAVGVRRGGGEPEHGAAGGRVLGGEAPGDPRYRDQDDSHT